MAPLQADFSLALSCSRMRLPLCALFRLENFCAGEGQNCDFGALRSTNIDERCQVRRVAGYAPFLSMILDVGTLAVQHAQRKEI